MTRVTVPTKEHKNRVERVRDRLRSSSADALCLFSSTAIEWVSGFHHLQTERPVCLVVTADTVAITVPRLELDRAQKDQFPILDEWYHYYDYPGNGTGVYHTHQSRTPTASIAVMLRESGVDSIFADSSGPPAYWGYSGSGLNEFIDGEVRTVDWISEFRKRKSPVEQDLIRESARWGNLAHRKLAEHINSGVHELRVTKEASLEASLVMLNTLGDRYDPRLASGFPAWCSLRAGPNTANPHGLMENRRLRHGDTLITGAIAHVGGYRSELERTMFLGNPSDEQRYYFEIMREAQSIGIHECGPGASCSAVDQAVHDYLAEQGVVEYAQHHTGHSLGMEGHESPFLDRGSTETMEPGEVYSIEPGIYLPDKAGFRHSDTVLITDTGTEILTFYPRDLSSNIIKG